MYTTDDIARATGAPLANIEATWPATVAALKWAGIDDHPTRIAAIATIATETGIFFPIPEEGDYNYFLREFGSPYEAQYFGRGTIQCSWSYNYKHYGDLIGVDLLNNPSLALSQDVAAKVLALYFREHNISGLAAAGDWYGVRRAINGGENGIDVQMRVVNALLAIPEPPDGPPPPAPVTTLVVNAALKQDPDHGPEVVADLAKGCVVAFTPEPKTDPDQYAGKTTTPSWAFVTVVSGTTQKLKPAAGLQGWLLRASLQTGGG